MGLFDIDTWQEILETVRGNKLRTVLTGFSVAWGILMLVVLLGSGRGLSQGVEYQFRDDAVNSIWIRPGQTSEPFAGLGPGRRVQLTNADHAEFAERVDGVEHITSRYYVNNAVLRRGAETQTFQVRSVHPGHQHLEKSLVIAGRYLNPLDLDERRKVAVIGRRVREALFPELGGVERRAAQGALGAWVEVSGVPFRIVGVYDDEGNDRETEIVYIPISTAQRTFGGADHVHQIMFTTGTLPLAATDALAEETRQRLARRHRFDPGDQRAVSVENLNEQFQRFMSLMDGIRLFVWMIGIGTLLAGIVGVSNIMMISVAERTREIGVRKALGATPLSIIVLVLLEAVLLTSVAGYLGLVAGVGLLELLARAPASDFFRNPSVELQTALLATALLVTAGAVAGFVPARRAAAIRPIDALRDE